jgi:Kef-type K+ transport system membrane component KefB
VNLTLKIYIIFLLSFSLNYSFAQDTQAFKNQKSLTLVLTKKSTSKKIIIKTAERLKIIKQDAQEIEGKIINIDMNTIYLKNGSVMLSNIYSIEKKNSVKRQVAGGLIACTGTIILVAGTIGAVGNDTSGWIVAGAVITASSIPFLVQKTYNSKRWTFTIE